MARMDITNKGPVIGRTPQAEGRELGIASWAPLSNFRSSGPRRPHQQTAEPEMLLDDSWENDGNPGPYVRIIKPAFDRAVGVCLSLLLLPVMMVVAVAVRVKLGKGVLYTQARVGKDGKPFTLYKFRTMLPDRRVTRSSHTPQGVERRTCHKRVDDPRHTSFGRFLRKTSLDELPQFWNVALGHMSMVGPRPELVSVVEERYEPWQHRRHSVKPGVTGLWQIAARDETPMYLHTRVDLVYVEEIGLRTDIRILAKTVPALVRRRGS
jgi:lipopolysaccharide/colanic/teichoic acid biosynthesis glycosyltransferase